MTLFILHDKIHSECCNSTFVAEIRSNWIKSSIDVVRTSYSPVANSLIQTNATGEDITKIANER